MATLLEDYNSEIGPIERDALFRSVSKQEARGLEAFMLMFFIKLAVVSLVFVWRVRPGNKMKSKWYVNVVFQRKEKLGSISMAFFCGKIFLGKFLTPCKQKFGFMLQGSVKNVYRTPFWTPSGPSSGSPFFERRLSQPSIQVMSLCIFEWLYFQTINSQEIWGEFEQRDPLY